MMLCPSNLTRRGRYKTSFTRIPRSKHSICYLRVNCIKQPKTGTDQELSDSLDEECEAFVFSMCKMNLKAGTTVDSARYWLFSFARMEIRMEDYLEPPIVCVFMYSG